MNLKSHAYLRSKLPAILLLLAAVDTPLRATTLFDVSGPPGSNTGLGRTNFNTAQAAAGESFTLTSAFMNISLTVDLTIGSPVTLSAWLTGQIGAGTTAANVIAFGQSTPSTSPFTVFSNLTLGPGTYYLVLAALDQPNDLGWNWTDTPAITTATGVVFNESFLTPGNTTDSWLDLPASYTDFIEVNSSPLFIAQMTGDAVPEPSSLVMTGLGAMLGLIAAYRRSRR